MTTPPLVKAESLLRLVPLLATPPARSVGELARTLGRHRRTVYRYLASLEAVGLPLYEQGGRYSLAAEGFLPPLQLDVHETLALFLAVTVARGRIGGLDANLESAYARLRHRLGAREDLDRLAPRVTAPASRTLSAPPQALEKLGAAIARQRRVRLHYRALDDPEPETRRLEPLRLFLFEDHWYLWAYDLDRQGGRRFRLSRVEGLEVTEEVFEPRELPLEGQAFHRWDRDIGGVRRVVLSVDSGLARWLEENPPHPSQEVGDRRVGYEVGCPSAMIPWLMALRGMRVEEPEELRQALAERARELWELHRS